MNKEIRQTIQNGQAILGIELGSTRIKSVLIGKDHAPIATGSHEWENRLENGIWTYHLDDVWSGLQNSYQKLAADVQKKYDVALTRVEAIGISAMMHGYLVFDKAGNQLVPFRTWRNTTTEQAANILTQAFEFNVPLRWNISHLYQALLNQEPHVGSIDFLTTLSGYVHWQLTGQKVLGVGDASGVFPIDSSTNTYDAGMVEKFDQLSAKLGFEKKLLDILPKVLVAGESAGNLTAEGARLLDPTGTLQPGVPMCPPEGDAGTGMVATNSVAKRTGNVSAGTSIFSMVVLEKPLSSVYTEIDMVTTPSGAPVAMVHCNNCTSDLDAWVRLFGQLLEAVGAKVERPDLYDALYFSALEGDMDCGGVMSYNYVSGEPLTGFDDGRPLLVRASNANFTLANFMRAQLFSIMATLKIGMDILTEKEHVTLDKLLGHGGLFKTKEVGQRLMAAALNVPVAVMESAGEGGAWGIALLAAYLVRNQGKQPLEDYLNEKVFAGLSGSCIAPVAEDVESFAHFMKRYEAGLAVERAAVDHL